MAESLLQVLLDHLGSSIRGELELFFGFKDEFEKLSSMFSTIQAVLEDAQEKQLKDKALKNWLQKLNAAAYEVDDILDECKTEVARYNQSRFGRYHPGIITFRHKVGKRMKEVMEKLDDLAEERKKFHYLRPNIAEREAVRRETGYILTEPEVYGRDKEKNDIVQILLNNVNDAEELSVLCIIGMGGLGKTTLAQMVFNDQRVTEHFSVKIWVCVSDDFDEKRLTKAIVESTGRPVGDMDLPPLQTKLKELLNGKRYLLVLDDVWNEDQEKWAKLRASLKGGARGASVVTTTRLEKVGLIMGTVKPHPLSSLSQEDCQLLFMQCAFGNKEEANPNLVPIGKEIVEKCGRVPLAAKTLGSLLRFKREESEWKHVRDSEIWSLPQDETSILPALRLSYHHLPLNLRQCFAYCAVYPKDTTMEKGSMITLWIAHGFLSSKGNLELEDVGNEVWNELYLRSFFQEIEKRKFGETYFKIHDLIHDLATSLISANTPSNNIRQLIVGGEAISIGFNEVVSSYSPSLLERFVSLRVLDLSNSDIKKLPSSIGDLVHLRFLDLSYNDIRSLPKRLCKLQNLQTLNLSYCRHISCLPKQISKLCSLRILLLKGCPLTSMPPRIRSLACLKTLDYFVVGERNGYQLGELQNWNVGGSLSITHLERVKKIMDAKGANLSAKANIHSLCMSWYNQDRYESQENIDEKVLEALEPHPNLESLEIIGFRGSGFPDWMIDGTVLENVTSIKIDDCMKCSCLPPFGKLPRLERLWLQYGPAEYVEQDVHSTRRFPSLRFLDIGWFPNLKGLVKKGGEENFSKLEEMKIWSCPSFIFPTSSSLKNLSVWGDADATNLSSISNLTSLTSLSISDNPAASLPEEIFKSLSNLRSLTIVYCGKLKELPISLVSLTALTDLEIGYCDALECLPEQGLEGLTSLASLKVRSCNMLKSLPDGLQYLTALNSLEVAGCREMVALPYGVHYLPSISFMGKDYNSWRTVESKLVELPQSLREACGLRDLEIGGFPGLVTLPDWLGDLTSLQSLMIRNCPQLQSLPASIMRMKNLQTLAIIECEKLTKRCERGMGEDWHKIAHIPNVYIYPSS